MFIGILCYILLYFSFISTLLSKIYLLIILCTTHHRYHIQLLLIIIHITIILITSIPILIVTFIIKSILIIIIMITIIIKTFNSHTVSQSNNCQNVVTMAHAEDIKSNFKSYYVLRGVAHRIQDGMSVIRCKSPEMINTDLTCLSLLPRVTHTRRC